MIISVLVVTIIKIPTQLLAEFQLYKLNFHKNMTACPLLVLKMILLQPKKLKHHDFLDNHLNKQEHSCPINISKLYIKICNLDFSNKISLNEHLNRKHDYKE